MRESKDHQNFKYWHFLIGAKNLECPAVNTKMNDSTRVSSISDPKMQLVKVETEKYVWVGFQAGIYWLNPLSE